MNGIGPFTRRLVELSRDADEPNLDARLRVERQLVARMTAGALGAGTNVAAATASSKFHQAVKHVGSGVSAFIRTKGVTVVVIGFALAGLSTYGAVSSEAQVEQRKVGERPSRSVPAPAAVPEPTSAAPKHSSAEPSRGIDEVRPAPPASEPRFADRSHGIDRPLAPTASNRRPRIPEQNAESPQGSWNSEVRSANGTQSLVSADELSAEAHALWQAQQALRHGDTARTLALVQQQDEYFSKGQLGAERAAARAMAICQGADLAKKRAALASFEQLFPRSVLVARVKLACAVEK